MNIASSRLEVVPKSPAVRRALVEGTQSQPALLALSPKGATSYAVGAAAYRNKGYRTLTKASTELVSAFLKAALPGGATVIDGVALAIGGTADVAGFLEDGSLSPGEVMDVGHLLAQTAVLATDRDPPVPKKGPDDGLRGDPPVLPEWMKAGEASIGVMAKVGNEIYSVPVTPTPFSLSAQGRDTTLADLAKAFGTASAPVAAALQIADVLSDPHFWKALASPSDPPPRFWADA